MNSDLSDIAVGLTQSLSINPATPSAVTSPIPFAAGTSSNPGVTFIADNTSGLFLNAVGQAGLVGGGLGVLANSTASKASSASTASTGSGYVVGEEITLAGGNYILPAVLRVETLSGSAIATVSVLTPGRYNTIPSNPVSPASTTGSGTGATFTVSWSTVLIVTDLAAASLAEALGASPFGTTLIALSSNIPVRLGGTGKKTLAAYSVLCGGTTSTGPIQSVDVGTAGQVLTSNGSGSLATFQTLTSTTGTRTRTVLTSGTATYTPPALCTSISIRQVGGGGGGGNGGNATSVATAGVATTFTGGVGSVNLNAGGGGAGLNTSSAGTGATGGTATGGDVNIVGAGTDPMQGPATVNQASPRGGASPFGGAGRGGFSGGSSSSAGANAATNSGSGGGGGGNNNSSTGTTPGTGGGAGGYVEKLISPAGTSAYNYAIGTGGTGGVSSSNGSNGGDGGSGIIIIDEYY